MNIWKTRLFWLLLLTALLYFSRKWLLSWWLGLPRPQYQVDYTSNIRVPMRDGIHLATDYYAPVGTGALPTILIRSPYGRCGTCSGFGWLLGFLGERFAERGYHVIIQDTRGRFDSEGEFNPYFHEKADGQDTLAWLRQQPWYNGSVGLWGPSYLGIVQWVIADEPDVKAFVPSVTASELYHIIFPDGALDLGLAVRWLALFPALDRGHQVMWRRYSPLMMQEVERAIRPAFDRLPLVDLDELILGKRTDFFQLWMEQYPPHNQRWLEMSQPINFEQVNAPSHLVGGWYDFFLRGLLADYAALRAAGKNPYLTIGPWHHFTHLFIMFDTLSMGLDWFDIHLKGQRDKLRPHPVRLYVMGAEEWRDLPAFPPPATERRYYLHPDYRLLDFPSLMQPAASHYRYDPAQPTPYPGGTQFNLYAGAVDNRQMELRPDVISFSTPPLKTALEIIGYVRLQLYVQSTREHTDFFGRLCDVHPDGRVINICDGLFRLTPGKVEPQSNGSLLIELDLWATAHCFQPGHQLRLLVASGAHPRWNRNPGTGNFMDDVLVPADQTVWHDADHPSALILPVVRG